jgi:hypothetical protein
MDRMFFKVDWMFPKVNWMFPKVAGMFRYLEQLEGGLVFLEHPQGCAPDGLEVAVGGDLGQRVHTPRQVRRAHECAVAARALRLPRWTTRWSGSSQTSGQLVDKSRQVKPDKWTTRWQVRQTHVETRRVRQVDNMLTSQPSESDKWSQTSEVRQVRQVDNRLTS